MQFKQLQDDMIAAMKAKRQGAQGCNLHTGVGCEEGGNR